MPLFSSDAHAREMSSPIETMEQCCRVADWSTASTEASLSENSSHGGQTPPKDRGSLEHAWVTAETLDASLAAASQQRSTALDSEQSIPKRTRRSNRRKKKNADVNGKMADTWDYTTEECAQSYREVVTVSDLLFDLGPTTQNGAGNLPKAAPVAFPNAMAEDYAAVPLSPCRTRGGPAGITSTNPCIDVATTVAPASTRTPHATRPRQQAAPTTLDLVLCSTSPPEAACPAPVAEPLLSSPCKGRSMGAKGYVSATPCNTPTNLVSAVSCNTGIVSATPCHTPTGNRIADASERAPVRPAPISKATVATDQPAVPDVFSLGIEQAPFSPCRPRALFPSSVGAVQTPSATVPTAQLPCSGSAGTVVADAMRSWLQSSGLPSGSAALAAELQAAVPETYED